MASLVDWIQGAVHPLDRAEIESIAPNIRYFYLEDPPPSPGYAINFGVNQARGDILGIMVDGAGIGSAMVANKIPGVRAAACYDLSTARNSREHNRANVLTLGAGLTGPALAWQIVQEWLATPWGGDRHARRVALIREVEDMYIRTDA